MHVSVQVTPLLLKSFCTKALSSMPVPVPRIDAILVMVTDMGGAAVIVKVSESDLVGSVVEVAVSVG